MAKELKSAATEFELTEAFWKMYKPDSVKETGLSGKLRDYENKLKEAKKLDAGTGSPVAKASKWGEVRAALHDLTEAMPKVIEALGKDKDSHKNLKASLDRAHKLLKGKTHPQYKTADEKAVLPTEDVDVGGAKWKEWLSKIPKTDSRHWSTILAEFHERAEGMPQDHAMEGALTELRKISRSGFLDKMTGPRTFDRDAERIVHSLQEYRTIVQNYIRDNVSALNQRNKEGQLNPWLNKLVLDLKTELTVWSTLKDAAKPV